MFNIFAAPCGLFRHIRILSFYVLYFYTGRTPEAGIMLIRKAVNFTRWQAEAVLTIESDSFSMLRKFIKTHFCDFTLKY